MDKKRLPIRRITHGEAGQRTGCAKRSDCWIAVGIPVTWYPPGGLGSRRWDSAPGPRDSSEVRTSSVRRWLITGIAALGGRIAPLNGDLGYVSRIKIDVPSHCQNPPMLNNNVWRTQLLVPAGKYHVTIVSGDGQFWSGDVDVQPKTCVIVQP